MDVSGTSCTSRATRSAGWCQTLPESGGISPLMICSRVDLPAPLRPMIDTRSRGVELQRHVVEQRQVSEGVRDVVEREKRQGIRDRRIS